MTEQVVQIPFVTTGFIKCAPMLLRYKTGYRQQERGSSPHKTARIFGDQVGQRLSGQPQISSHQQGRPDWKDPVQSESDLGRREGGMFEMWP